MATKGASRARSRPRLRDRTRDAFSECSRLFREHELLSYASNIARTMLVASVSIFLLLLGIAGAIGRQDLWTTHAAPQIQSRVLPDVYSGANQTVERIFSANSPGLIVFAALLAIWEVSGSVRGVSGALNRIYGTEERRSWKRRYPISLALALVVNVALLTAILLAMAVGGAVHGSATVPFAILRWFGAVLLIAFAFGLLVRYAPAEPRAKKWTSLGSGLVVAGWIVESLAFKWYIESLADFRSAVGSLTVVLLVIGYLYVASIILLVGIEVDELMRANVDDPERTIMHLARRVVPGSWLPGAKDRKAGRRKDTRTV